VRAMNDAVAWHIDKSALTHSEPRRYAIVRTWNSYRRNRACYADDGRRTLTICDLPSHARWAAGSVTSSWSPFAVPAIVCSIAVATKRHGGNRSSLIRRLSPGNYRSRPAMNVWASVVIPALVSHERLQ
jgi:hypothetical protein